MRSLRTTPSRVLLSVIVTLLGAAASAQTPEPPAYPGGCETPVSQRVSQAGCYFVGETQLEEMTAPVFWHLYTYPTVSAAEAAVSQNGTVVQSLGKIWVFTLANQTWRPRNGERISVIGPLQTTRGTRYTARYMESILPPGLPRSTGNGHFHPGAEAFYIVSGAQCLETPAGITVSRAGDSAIMQPGLRMTLSGVGTENRAAVLLVLHDSAQPWIARDGAWTPSRRCPR